MTFKRKIIFLIISTGIIHLIFFVAANYLINNKNELALELKKVKSIKNIKTLFLGDSHIVRSIDVSKIDSSYSLAYFGENNMMNFYKLKYCIDHYPTKPNYVILPCDIVTYTEGYNQYRTNKNFYYSIVPFSEIKNLNKNVLSSYYDYFKIKLIPYSEWQYVLNIKNINRQKKTTIKFSDLTSKEKIKDASYFIQYELLMGGDKTNFHSNNAFKYLEQTIKICKENHIKLVFVKFPLTKYIFEEIKNNVDNSYITHRPSENLIRNEGIPILDFEYLYQNNSELFFDSHHLNLEGKTKFTVVFKQKLDSLYKVY